MGETMQKKGYGRIYVADETKVQAVLDAIKEIDSYEFDGYYIKDLVAPYKGEVELLYTHKFEIDIDLLTALCWKRGIWIWVISKMYEDSARDFNITKFIEPTEDLKQQ